MWVSEWGKDGFMEILFIQKRILIIMTLLISLSPRLSWTLPSSHTDTRNRDCPRCFLLGIHLLYAWCKIFHRNQWNFPWAAYIKIFDHLFHIVAFPNYSMLLCAYKWFSVQYVTLHFIWSVYIITFLFITIRVFRGGGERGYFPPVSVLNGMLTFED